MASRSYWPIWQLTLARLKEFLRQPAAIFWVYGFPIIMMMSLGIAFREDVSEEIAVDVVQEEGSGREIAKELAADKRFKVRESPEEDWRKRLQAGKTDLVVELDAYGGFRLWDEPHRAESRIARYAVEAALLRPREGAYFDPSRSPREIKHLEQAGSRYIDFLLPGMIGMGLMGGGLWGVGFVIVDMRVRKLLKRFLATPMRRSHFLLAIMLSRLVFTLGDILVLLVFGWLVFDVRTRGSFVDLTAAVIIGATAFAGIGLLVASRAETIETASGLMNLVMLPMWILSGVFFSSERFPEVVQPVINLLPLTALNQLLRGIMLEGESIARYWSQVVILVGYAVIGFAVALKVFRWR
jgi:ABC-2 type transport system permease protein